MASVAPKLKALRKRAHPPITIRGMADRLGMPWGTYSRYESASEFKRAHLPMDLARRIADILADHGVDRSEVMALAGADPGPGGGDRLSRNEAALLDIFRQLSTQQRGVVFAVAAAMIGAPIPDALPALPEFAQPTIHEGGRDYRGPEQDAA